MTKADGVKLTTKITSLTAEQEAKFPAYVAEWKGYGLSTERADRPRAEAAIRLMYEGAGLKPPRIVWMESPLGNALGLVLFKKLSEVATSDLNGASVGASVRDSVRASVGASVRDSVGASVWASVGDSVWASVWASVGASVWASVGDSVYGQHDASWLAFYRFFHTECGLIEQTKKLRGLWELCQSAGWVLPYQHVCFVSERHAQCHLDANERIHCETGPAIAYADGFEIFAWHGTRIPAEWIIDRKSLTPQIALTHPNIEQRRAACELLGWNAILTTLKAKTINKDADPQIGELVEVTIPEIGKERFLRVLCGTQREFALPVPPSMTTALEANAWTYGYDTPSTFTKPELRT